MKDKIVILMATYNGEQYINKQIQSILLQTYSNWELIICDDCSSDNTFMVISKYTEIDSRIKVIQNSINLGPVQNFNHLLEFALESNYIMFSDQDDIWEDNKVEVEYLMMREAEKKYGKETPLLIYTNLEYVDEKLLPLNTKTPFFGPKNFKIMLGYNFVWGCTMLLNKSLATLAYPIPKEAQNHDYWIALHSELIGKNIFLNEKTLLYRQHNSNVTGELRNKTITNKILNLKKYYNLYRIQIEQNIAFCNKFNYIKNSDLLNYSAILRSNGITSIFKALKFGLRRFTWMDTLCFYSYLFFRKKLGENK